MLAVLRDAALRPELFNWFGPIPQPEIEEWSRRVELVLPSDLLQLWQTTGGGDVFESETILRPTVPSKPNGSFVADDIESVNHAHIAAGRTTGLYIFQEGTFLSAIRLHDQKFVTLTRDYGVKNLFSSLDDWYVNTLRAEFCSRYGLGPT